MPALATAASCILAFGAVHAQDGEDFPAESPAEIENEVSHGVPDLCVEPNAIAARSGNWSDVATWVSRRMPGAGDKARIPPGITVTFDVRSEMPLQCLDVAGSLVFRTDRDTRLTVGTLKVLESGSLSIGTERTPVAADHTAELVIASQELDPLDDVEQFGTGLIGLGRIRIHGAPRNPTFVRLASEPLQGQRTLKLGRTVAGWSVGDRLVLPDTRQLLQGQRNDDYRPQWEEAVIAAIAGETVTLAAPLAFDHRGARNGAGALEVLPHTGNLSRNVVVRSALPGGVRGHVLFSTGSDVDIRYALFKDLGRTRLGPLDSARYDAAGVPRNFGTNQNGRYALQFLGAFGARTPAGGYAFTVIGNAVSDSSKWGIALRDSHYGLVKDNVIYNAPGAGIIAVDGAESFNLLEHNFVVRSQGSGEFAPRSAYVAPIADPGGDGSGLWLRGPNNYVRNNVVANVDVVGYDLAAGALGTIRMPQQKGADPSKARELVEVEARTLDVRGFTGNEAYGALETGVTIGWNGQLTDTHIWHAWRHAVTAVPADRLVIDGVTVRGDPAALKGRFENAAGVWITNYAAKTVVVRNANVQGMRVGVASPFFAPHLDIDPARGDGSVTVENSFFRDYVGIAVATTYIRSANLPGVPPKKVVVRGSRFDALPGVPVLPQQPPAAVSMNYGMAAGDTTQREPVLVYDFNQKPGDTFRAFYSLGLPAAAAPCPETRAEVVGFLCVGDGKR